VSGLLYCNSAAVLTVIVRFCLKSVKWRCEEFHDLYSSPGIIQMIKSRWMISAGHVARGGGGGGETHVGVWWGNLKEKNFMK